MLLPTEKIEDLPLIPRAKGILWRQGLDTVGEVRQMSDEDLMRLPGFGPLCLLAVRLLVGWAEKDPGLE